MIIVLQAVGAVAVLVGLAAIGYGIPIRDFGFGNLLIMAGTVGLCTGLLLLGLSVVAWEMRLVARRLAAPSRQPADPRARAALPPFPGGPQAPVAAGEGGPLFTRDQPPAPPVPPPLESTVAPPVAPPWHDDGSRARPDTPPEVGPPPPQKPRRNLMFSSSMRKDRERTTAAQEPTEPRAATPPPPPPAAPEVSEAPPASFEDAWPKSGRGRSSELQPRRPNRLAPAPAPAESTAGAVPEPAAPPPAPAEQAPAVTVLKSGVVDGMAYSLYSDGSIEAQMPEGMMRFASIDELRAHLNQRT